MMECDQTLVSKELYVDEFPKRLVATVEYNPSNYPIVRIDRIDLNLDRSEIFIDPYHTYISNARAGAEGSNEMHILVHHHCRNTAHYVKMPEFVLEARRCLPTLNYGSVISDNNTWTASLLYILYPTLECFDWEDIEYQFLTKLLEESESGRDGEMINLVKSGKLIIADAEHNALVDLKKSKRSDFERAHSYFNAFYEDHMHAEYLQPMI